MACFVVTLLVLFLVCCMVKMPNAILRYSKYSRSFEGGFVSSETKLQLLPDVDYTCVVFVGTYRISNRMYHASSYGGANQAILYNIGEYYVCFSDIQHRGHLLAAGLSHKSVYHGSDVESLGAVSSNTPIDLHSLSLFLGRQQLLLGTDPPSLSTDAVRCGRLDSRFYSAVTC
jgi:hypothetical protein